MKNVNESGRSMVEMLGVLAIIGVLSIGGIAGYTMAMNKYNANEIVNAVVQGAVYCRTQGTIPPDITTGVKGLGSLSCEDKPSGTVSFQVSSTADVATAVVKSLTSYNSKNGALNETANARVSTGAVNTSYYYKPTT